MQVRCVACGRVFGFDLPVPVELPAHERAAAAGVDCVGRLWEPAHPSMLTRAELPWFAALILAAVVLRILWVVHVNVDPNDGRFDDSVAYHNVAHLLARGEGYVSPYGLGVTARWAPAYTATLAAFYKLFGFHVTVAKVLNIAFAAATIALAYLFARRAFDRRVALLGALILALFPGQIYFSTLVLTETMFAMVFLLVLFLAFVWTVERREALWWQVFVLGLLTGMAGMVRSEGVFLAVVLLALWAITVRPWRTVARYGALLALGVVLALTPWTVRNPVELHAFIPLRSGTGDVIATSLDPDRHGIGIGEGDPLPLPTGLRYQITHPWEVPTTVGRRLQNLYRTDADGIRMIQKGPGGGATVPGYEQPLTPAEERGWRRLADAFYFVAGAAALVGFGLVIVRRNRGGLVVVVAALGWTLLFSYFETFPRYHFPLDPLIAVLAAVFAVFVWDAGSAAYGRSPSPPSNRLRSESGRLAG